MRAGLMQGEIELCLLNNQGQKDGSLLRWLY